MEDIAKQLTRIRKKDKDRPRKKITILGAGMAGLAAAYELKNLGHDVQVFEASDRVGGRVWTKRFDSGQYHEFGAMRIPKAHDYTHHYVKELELKLRPFVTSHQEKDCWYDIRGVVTRIENAQKNLLPHFKLSDDERKLVDGPDCVIPALFGFAVSSELRALSDEARKALFGPTLYSGVLTDLDCKSLGDLLKERLSGPDAMELIGATTGLEVWWDRCLTMFIRDEIVGTGAPLEEIVGGMDLLPTKLAKKVHGSRIHLNSPVRAIRATDDGVSLSIEQNGKVTHHNADFVLCTIPFSVLRHLQIDGISLGKRKAIRNLSYASASKVLLHCKTRFWETGPDPILGG
ncbi:MAG TPA: NAD(P)/FAD-dependent oxidoreductase, partial [Rhodothermales bacterium]|nr:NAD(P)/FAD-dependent oxidoreductase [Rhodothermales bacterium]